MIHSCEVLEGHTLLFVLVHHGYHEVLFALTIHHGFHEFLCILVIRHGSHEFLLALVIPHRTSKVFMVLPSGSQWRPTYLVSLNLVTSRTHEYPCYYYFLTKSLVSLCLEMDCNFFLCDHGQVHHGFSYGSTSTRLSFIVGCRTHSYSSQH